MDRRNYIKIAYIIGFILIPIMICYYLIYDKSIESRVANTFILIISFISNIILVKEAKKEIKDINSIKIIFISSWLLLTTFVPGIFGFLFLLDNREKKIRLLPEIKKEKVSVVSYAKSIIIISVFLFVLLVLPHMLELKLWQSVIIYIFIFGMILISFYNELKVQFKIFIKNIKVYFPFIIKRYFIMIGVMLLVAIPIFYINGGMQANNQQELNEMMHKMPLFVFLLSTIYAPFAEEGVFRLSLFKLFKNKYLFIIISGVLFGALHVIGKSENMGEYLYILQYSALGICLAKAYYDSRNIFVPISMHFIQNFLAALLSLLLF